MKKIEMKENFKIKLTWKQSLVAMFVLAFFYSAVLYLAGTNQSVKIIIIQGALYGVLFILIFPWTMNKLIGKRLNTIVPKILSGEQVLEEFSGSLFRGLEAVGGRVFLTNYQIIFQSHSLNIQKGQTNINYSEIESVEKRKTMKIVNNGIKITTKEGEEYCFVVNNREVQIQKIKDKLTV